MIFCITSNQLELNKKTSYVRFFAMKFNSCQYVCQIVTMENEEAFDVDSNISGLLYKSLKSDFKSCKIYKLSGQT